MSLFIYTLYKQGPDGVPSNASVALKVMHNHDVVGFDWRAFAVFLSCEGGLAEAKGKSGTQRDRGVWILRLGGCGLLHHVLLSGWRFCCRLPR